MGERGRYKARNKTDLMIEVWEELDCETVGATEIMAIEEAVLERFGPSAVDSPMKVARMLADEGAALRHHEIMTLYLERRSVAPYEPAFRNILKIEDLAGAARSLRRLEGLRRKFTADSDKEGLRRVREKGREGRETALERARDTGRPQEERTRYKEIAEWLTLWMQSPEMFETWIERRLDSPDFRKKFPDVSSEI